MSDSIVFILIVGLLFEVIIAPFMVATPQCTGLRWCIMRGADTIISMWLVIGAWFMQKLGGYSLS